jgi:Secretion system C-terminal sorting domain
MTSLSRFFSFRKSIFVLLPLLVLGAYAVHQADSEPGGITGYSKIGCSSCHGPRSTATVVKISTAATQIIAGGTYVFQFSVSNPSEFAAGCDISVDNGAVLGLNGTNSGLWIPSQTGELTHTEPLTFTGDSAVWTFTYTAPLTAGTDHIYAAGNAVDNDGGLSNVTTYAVTVVGSPGPHVSAPALVRDTALREDTSQIQFWVKNSGTSELDVYRYAMEYGTSYQIPDDSSLSIPVGDSSEVTVDFIPSIKGTIVDTFHIYSNDSTRAVTSVALVGLGTSGVCHISENPVRFAPIALAHSDTLSVTISNTGNGLLAVTPNILALSNSDFALISLKPADTSYELVPKGTVVATFSFTPSTVGNDTGLFPLAVSEYEGNTIDTSILLIGMGTQSASVDPTQPNNIAFIIAPNPSVGLIHLSSTGMTGSANIEVCDPAGKIVFRDEIILGTESSINLPTLANGTYVLAIKSSEGQSFVSKIVLQR